MRRLTQVVPATGPANTTLPAAGARTSSPTGAAMSMPRCPGPNGPARASNPRTNGPPTGIHKSGTRARSGTGTARGVRAEVGTGRPAVAAGMKPETNAMAVKSNTRTHGVQPRTSRLVAFGPPDDM
jgi:hypothetical protein